MDNNYNNDQQNGQPAAPQSGESNAQQQYYRQNGPQYIPPNQFYGQVNGRPEPDGNMGLSVASMVLGIIALLICCIYPVALILGIISLVLGIIALKSETVGGKGMAIAGMILSVIVIFSAAVLLLLALITGSGITFITELFD